MQHFIAATNWWW